ncbi:MAG: hypothetical protein WJU30_00443 [Candidatus Phytoplasma pruni]
MDNNDYDDTKRPQIRLNDKGIGSLKIQISIEQKEIITNKNPQLEIIVDYELVDSQGKAYGSGSSQTIENKITNLS